MDWDKIKTFYFVARSRSFTNASHVINISQSAISRQINELERTLGLKLFERHARGLVLTQAGETLYESACNVYSQLYVVENNIRNNSLEPSGTVKIATASGWIAALLLSYIDEFYIQHPKLILQIQLTETHLDMSFREADVAILSVMPPHANVIQRYLMSFHLKLFASKKYLDKYGRPRTVDDLDQHRLITYSQENTTFTSAMEWHLSAGKVAGEARKPILMINSGLNLYYAAKCGAGIVTLASENPLTRDPELEMVLPDVNGAVIEAYFIYPRFLDNSTNIKALEAFLRNIIKTNGWA